MWLQTSKKSVLTARSAAGSAQGLPEASKHGREAPKQYGLKKETNHKEDIAPRADTQHFVIQYNTITIPVLKYIPVVINRIYEQAVCPL